MVQVLLSNDELAWDRLLLKPEAVSREMGKRRKA
jgi:hypothetical protein